MMQRKSIGDLFAESPGNPATMRDEPICSTPPHASYRSSSSNSHNNTPDIDFGRQSPLFMSMSQRARKLGVDVTWASSPRRSASPLIDRKMPTPPAKLGHYQASPTALVHRRSFKERQPGKPHKTPPKGGLYKFQEELKSIMPLLKHKQDVDSGVASTVLSDQALSSSNDVDSSSEANGASVARAHKRPGSLSNELPCKMAKAEERVIDYLSTSIQQEFLDDSDLDMELFRSSQDVENGLKASAENQKKQSATKTNQSPNKSNSHFFNDSFPESDFIEELMSSKELDLLISSQSIYIRPQANKLPIERHKSMPFQQCTSNAMGSVSDEALSGLNEEIFLTAVSSPPKASNSDDHVKPRATRNYSRLGRHNSMPASPSAPFTRHAMATKRRLLRSFRDSAAAIVSSEDDSE